MVQASQSATRALRNSTWSAESPDPWRSMLLRSTAPSSPPPIPLAQRAHRGREVNLFGGCSRLAAGSPLLGRSRLQSPASTPAGTRNECERQVARRDSQNLSSSSIPLSRSISLRPSVRRSRCSFCTAKSKPRQLKLRYALCRLYVHCIPLHEDMQRASQT